MFWRFATSNSTAPGTRAEAVPPRHVSPFRRYSWHALPYTRAPFLQEREDPFTLKIPLHFKTLKVIPPRTLKILNVSYLY